MPIGRVGSEFIVNTTTANDQDYSSVTALTDGRFVVTWQSYEGSADVNIRARIYNSNGTPSGNDFIVSSTTLFQRDYTPTVTALPDGRFIVTWNTIPFSQSPGVYVQARIFDANGAPAGTDFTITTTFTSDTNNPSSAPEIAALSDGRFFAVWSSNDTGDGSGSCIRGRLYDANGMPLGNDFVVNTTAPYAQSNPSITVLGADRYLVTWDSRDAGDGTEGDIRGRIFTASGAPLGNDFIVNSTSTGPQTGNAVAPFSDGRSVIVFSSYNGDILADIPTDLRVRFLDTAGNPSGADIIISTTTGPSRADIVVLADGRILVCSTFQGGITATTEVNAVLLDPSGALIGEYRVPSLPRLSYYENLSSLTALADGRVVITWTSDDNGDGSGSVIRAQIFDPTVFIGTSAADVYSGGSFKDTITGGEGADTLAGLAGNDVIWGEGGADRLYGSSGTDQLYGGSGQDYLSGGDNADYLSGGAENDVLLGGAGADTMIGGSGNDQFYVDHVGDIALDYVGGGDDRVYASVSYALASGSEIERLSTNSNVGTAAINLTGNEFGNIITGNNGSNILGGRGGNDLLYGLGGKDYFVFSAAPNGVTNMDKIADFTSVDDLMFLDDAGFFGIAAGYLAQSAYREGAGAQTALTSAQRVIHDTLTGDLWWDQDGVGGIAPVRFANVGAGTAVLYYDFFGI